MLELHFAFPWLKPVISLELQRMSTEVPACTRPLSKKRLMMRFFGLGKLGKPRVNGCGKNVRSEIAGIAAAAVCCPPVRYHHFQKSHLPLKDPAACWC